MDEKECGDGKRAGVLWTGLVWCGEACKSEEALMASETVFVRSRTGTKMKKARPMEIRIANWPGMLT